MNTAAIKAVLEDALVPKRDGTKHHRACLNRTTNASPTPRSERCRRANEALESLEEQMAGENAG